MTMWVMSPDHETTYTRLNIIYLRYPNLKSSHKVAWTHSTLSVNDDLAEATSTEGKTRS